MNNIYTKLMEVRSQFNKKDLKKTGHNKFANYYYFELGDFLPTAQELLKENGLATFINFETEQAILTLVNCENPKEFIEFVSPMSSAQLKGCHDVQNLGAVQTYIRRYLYVNLLEITEHDALDSTTGKDDRKPPKKENTPSNTNIPKEDSRSLETNTVDSKQVLTDKQIKRLYILGNKAQYTSEKVGEDILNTFGVAPKHLTKQQYDRVCNGYQAKIDQLDETK